MASLGDEATITKMVRAGFMAEPIDCIVGRPKYATIHHVTEQLAPVCTSLDTMQWGGQHGCLKMILGGTDYKAVLGTTRSPSL